MLGVHSFATVLTTLRKGASLSGSGGKGCACSMGDQVLIPGSGRSPGGGNGNSLAYSCQENSMDREIWWATVHGVAESDMTSLYYPQRYDWFPLGKSLLPWGTTYLKVRYRGQGKDRGAQRNKAFGVPLGQEAQWKNPRDSEPVEFCPNFVLTGWSL